MKARSNLWKKNLLRMRNPSKLLEKSKSLELNRGNFGLIPSDEKVLYQDLIVR
jgi:hypothetical protein